MTCSKNFFLFFVFFIFLVNCSYQQDNDYKKIRGYHTKTLDVNPEITESPFEQKELLHGPGKSLQFIGQNAYEHIQNLMAIGYRIPGSYESKKTANYIKKQLVVNGWDVDFQEFVHENIIIRNIIAKNQEDEPSIILGTHYDTREFSDAETITKESLFPVPGANDGSSGTAVLLELSRILSINDTSIWIVLFDAEDQGRINGWDWSIGSQYFADHLEAHPKNVIIIDMIGDKDLNIYKEKNSAPDLTEKLWDIADVLGYGNNFINQEKYSMIDDHLPFINKGISTSLVIDFDYPYWHTRNDTIDKISPQSLQVIGNVVEYYIKVD